MSTLSERAKLLIHGYVRNVTKNNKLFMNVPQEIILFIFLCYPRYFLFGSYNKEIFKVSENRMSIKGTNDCGGYLVFADLSDDNENGINTGVHYWSIKLLMTRYYQQNQDVLLECMDENEWCWKSIGVTSFKPAAAVKCSVDGWLHGTYGSYSYLNGFNEYEWHFDDTITVKLDCDKWKVSYFVNDNVTPLKIENINANWYYYIAAAFCGHEDETYAKIVDTPLVLMQ